MGKLKASCISGRNVMVQSCWKTVWQFLKMLNINLPYDTEISLLKIPQRNKNRIIPASVLIVNKWRPLKCGPTRECRNKMSIPTVVFFKKGMKYTGYNMDEPQKCSVELPWSLLLFSHSVQFSRSVVSDSLRPHESQHARPPCLSPTPGVHSNIMSIESVMPSSHLIFCRPLLLLPPIPPSIRVFSNESTPRMRWPKYWSFSFSISPSSCVQVFVTPWIVRFSLVVQW